jgi:hypothetical protein
MRLVSAAVLVGAASLTVGCAPTATTSETARSEEPAPETVSAFRYAPFTATYRLASHNRTEQEFGGQVSTFEFGAAIYLRAEAEPGADGFALSLTVDSMVPTGTLPPGIDEGDFAAAAGATFGGTLHPTGQITEFAGTESTNAMVTQMNQSMSQFFTPVPEGGAHPGQTWTDSGTVMGGASGMDIEIATVTVYESGDWVEENGTRVLPVTAKSDVSVAGGGMQGGTEITIDGTGVSWAGLRLAADGRMLSRFSADTMDMTATVIAMGTIIPITQVRYDSLSVIR